MFKGEFKFDLKEALSLRRNAQYSDAYLTTNESIKDWMQLTPVAHPRVLTVAASGDQPLMYAAHGASHIDTFDITIYACMLMDFKTTALQHMDLLQYMQTVRGLVKLTRAKKLATKTHLDILHIANNMPQRTRELMHAVIKNKKDVFYSGYISFPDDEAAHKNIQTAAPTQFNFIWANLANVHTYLDGKYDIINTSNIIDHSITSTNAAIKNLWPYLNVGGYILCTTICSHVMDAVEAIDSTLHELNAKVSTPTRPHNDLFSPIIIQKAR